VTVSVTMSITMSITTMVSTVVRFLALDISDGATVTVTMSIAMSISTMVSTIVSVSASFDLLVGHLSNFRLFGNSRGHEESESNQELHV